MFQNHSKCQFRGTQPSGSAIRALIKRKKTFLSDFFKPVFLPQLDNHRAGTDSSLRFRSLKRAGVGFSTTRRSVQSAIWF